MGGDEIVSMIDNSKEIKHEKCLKCEDICSCCCDKKCIYDESCYNNKNCCYLHPKDVSIVQVNDPNLFQLITSFNNLYLTAIPLEINTASYLIESSSIQRPNDTLIVNDPGIYSIYVSLKYSFKFNENIKVGDIFRVDFLVKGNEEEIFTINDTVTVPNIVDGESEEIINTIQGKKLQIIDKNLPYKINIELRDFQFDLTILNQIIITDLVLIVEKII